MVTPSYEKEMKTPQRSQFKVRQETKDYLNETKQFMSKVFRVNKNVRKLNMDTVIWELCKTYHDQNNQDEINRIDKTEREERFKEMGLTQDTNGWQMFKSEPLMNAMGDKRSRVGNLWTLWVTNVQEWNTYEQKGEKSPILI